MGLDNGIYLRIKGHRERMKLSGKRFFWDNELAYWRKCWGIREVIIGIIFSSQINEYTYIINREQLKEVIAALKKFNKKSYWDKYAHSIWTFEEFKEGRKRILRNLKWAYRYMKRHPEVIMYFYDSY